MEEPREESLADFIASLTEDEQRFIIAGLDDAERAVLMAEMEKKGRPNPPPNPAGQAAEIDVAYRLQPHLEYLSDRLAQAVADVEAGQSRFLAVSMPPRMGKSTQVSTHLPVWLLRKHPDWRIGLISHSPSLSSAWGRQVRRIVTEYREKLGITIAADAGAVTDWETTAGGAVQSRSVGQSITGLGFRVMLIDDAVKDYAAAHSPKARQALWEWWLSNARTRVEGASLVVVVGTRWHEDDFIGRLLRPDDDEAADNWEVIRFPALAEEDDVLGREPGDPLLSPLANETREVALKRWANLRRVVGTYTWSALYQQSPVPSEGLVFLPEWWRFWTTDPELVDATTVLWDPLVEGRQGSWLDSWDCTFKASDTSDYVVGQRWVRVDADRFLVAQRRDRLTFTETVSAMLEWEKPDSAGDTGKLVHRRLVEEAANGNAIIDTLKRKIAGLHPVRATSGKEARARAVSPEVESGNVYLPHPSEPGHEWVNGLLEELQRFPSAPHDDMVDALTQGLAGLREQEVPSVDAIVIGQTNYWGAV